MNEITAIETITAIEPDEQLELPGMPEPIVVELSLEQIVDQLIDAIGLAQMTMYQVWKVTNGALDILDVHVDGKAYRIPSQMLYQYNRNKMVVKGEKVDFATPEQARAFAIKFVSRKLAK